MATLYKCPRCKAPQVEFEKVFLQGPTTVGCNGEQEVSYLCPECMSDCQVKCSYCDESVSFSDNLSELDDGSFLCPKCDTQLLEELDDFTSNYKSYTDGSGKSPWYNHGLSSTPSKQGTLRVHGTPGLR